MSYKMLCVTLAPTLDRKVVIKNFEPGRFFRIVDHADSFVEPGGKGINVAVLLSDFKISSVNMGFLGGSIGSIIQSKLSLYGNITTQFVYIEEETRENIIIIDPDNRTLSEINLNGPEISQSDMDYFTSRYRSTLNLVDNVVVSGLIPRGITLNSYANLFRMAKAMNKKTYIEAIGEHFDNVVTNSCPMIVRPDLRKSNLLFGQPLKEDIQEYMRAGSFIVSRGAELVIMSYKTVSDIIVTKNGGWIFTAKGEIDPAKVKNSGDAFMSGMIYHNIVNGFEPFEAARYGMAFALNSTKYISKKVGSIEEINKSLDDFTIDRIG